MTVEPARALDTVRTRIRRAKRSEQRVTRLVELDIRYHPEIHLSEFGVTTAMQSVHVLEMVYRRDEERLGRGAVTCRFAISLGERIFLLALGSDFLGYELHIYGIPNVLCQSFTVVIHYFLPLAEAV